MTVQSLRCHFPPPFLLLYVVQLFVLFALSPFVGVERVFIYRHHRFREFVSPTGHFQLLTSPFQPILPARKYRLAKMDSVVKRNLWELSP